MKLWLANGNCVLADDARGARQRAIDQGYINPDVPCEVVRANDDGTPAGVARVIMPGGPRFAITPAGEAALNRANRTRKPAARGRGSSRGSRRGSSRTPPEGS